MGAVLDGYNLGVTESADLDAKVDAALIAVGRQIANHIDFATENLSGQELTKALYLTPHLVNILREMKATPAAREDVAKAPTKAEKKSALASVSNIPRPSA